LCIKGYHLGCKFKFPYSIRCFFQVFGGYLFTTFVSAQVVLFFQRRFWTARNTKSLSPLSVSVGKKKGIINSDALPSYSTRTRFANAKNTHTRTL
jgi:hypothetical protein